MDPSTKKKIVVVAALAAAGYFLYRILKKDDTPKEAIENTIKEPVKVIDATFTEVKDAVAPIVKKTYKKHKHYKKKIDPQIKKESAEHPELSQKTIKQIVKDHKAMTKKEHKSRFKAFTVSL